MTAFPERTAAWPEFAREVRAGLLTPGQKTLPCQYLYDDAGTLLFQAITQLPEYGLSRAEERIIRRHAGDFAERVPETHTVIELGSGDGSKTRAILQALGTRGPLSYYPVDVSRAALSDCARDLGALAEVKPIEASYLDGLQQATWHRKTDAPIAVLFLGSTLGNFPRHEGCAFLGSIRKLLEPRDTLLLGTDFVQAEERMLAAYNDRAGVTAAFNLNLLARINRELGGNFKLAAFAHEARYNAVERRIEMHLRSLVRQDVVIPGAGMTVGFRRGETIWTESSHKFTPTEVHEIGSRGGFRFVQQWLDAEWSFADTLFTADGDRRLVLDQLFLRR